MSKFACPHCGTLSTVNNVVVGKQGVTRYRACRICKLNFATVESVKDTPRVRQTIGETKALAIWGEQPFQYRTMKQQQRFLKTKPIT